MILQAQHIMSDVLTNVMKIIMDNNEKDNHMVRSTNGWTNGWLVVPQKWNMYYSWWRHQMETFSALLPLCAGNSQITGDPPPPPPPPHTHKGQWRGASMFSLICAWINGWVNKAGELRRRRSHYDATVMEENPVLKLIHSSSYVWLTDGCAANRSEPRSSCNLRNLRRVSSGYPILLKAPGCEMPSQLTRLSQHNFMDERKWIYG